jgi:hypothetical protein
MIIKEGTLGESMYFISKGSVGCFAAGKLLTVRSDGAFFGEMSLLTGQTRTATLIAQTHCSCFRLSKTAFDSVLTKYPDFLARLRSIAEERLQSIAEERQRRQNELNHAASDGDANSADESGEVTALPCDPLLELEGLGVSLKRKIAANALEPPAWEQLRGTRSEIAEIKGPMRSISSIKHSANKLLPPSAQEEMRLHGVLEELVACTAAHDGAVNESPVLMSLSHNEGRPVSLPLNRNAETLRACASNGLAALSKSCSAMIHSTAHDETVRREPGVTEDRGYPISDALHSSTGSCSKPPISPLEFGGQPGRGSLRPSSAHTGQTWDADFGAAASSSCLPREPPRVSLGEKLGATASGPLLLEQAFSARPNDRNMITRWQPRSPRPLQRLRSSSKNGCSEGRDEETSELDLFGQPKKVEATKDGTLVLSSVSAKLVQPMAIASVANAIPSSVACFDSTSRWWSELGDSPSLHPNRQLGRVVLSAQHVSSISGGFQVCVTVLSSPVYARYWTDTRTRSLTEPHTRTGMQYEHPA